MSDIADIPVFLSASFPSDDERGRAFPADPGIVADAVSAVSTALLHGGARIVFGSHPTITPLLLFICDQGGWTDRIDAYVTEYYRDQITEETWRLANAGYGRLHFTPSTGDLGTDLETMRNQMLDEASPQAAVFIGGMEGVIREWELARERGIPSFPVKASGAAAAQLEPVLPGGFAERPILESEAFALVGREIVRLIREQSQ